MPCTSNGVISKTVFINTRKLLPFLEKRFFHIILRFRTSPRDTKPQMEMPNYKNVINVLIDSLLKATHIFMRW